MATAVRGTPAESPPTDPKLLAALARLEAKVEALSLQVHRAEATLRTKVVAPVQRLTVKEAAERLRKDVRTVERLLARRLFTDSRGHKRNGCPWLIYADEVDTYHECGEEGLKLFRERMGRA
jgi:excisionase family DNA binding protein